ncbi:hypothetical protein ABDK75_17415 [Gluconobacter sp. OJA]|uniref:hypothetical protein n=1 Tax=Gluconobacter sp. OJA TaxID=3145197 RepID=UPI0031F855EB
MTKDTRRFSRIFAGAILLVVARGSVEPALATQQSSLGPCEKAAAKLTGPAWIHLSLQITQLASIRNGGPKSASIQLPTTSNVGFDGYLPADGSDISIRSGRETNYLSKISSIHREGKPSEVSLQPGTVFTGVFGTFRALPSLDGKIVVTPDITLITDPTLRGSRSDSSDVELPDYQTIHIDKPIIVGGLRCETHADLAPVADGSKKSQALEFYGIRVSAYRTQ